jgi:hypothetical protein
VRLLAALSPAIEDEAQQQSYEQQKGEQEEFHESTTMAGEASSYGLIQIGVKQWWLV